MDEKKFSVLPLSVQEWFIKFVDPFISFIVRFNVHPNFFTVLGLIISLIGAYYYGIHQIRLGGLFILLGGLCDVIDGKVARKSGLSSKFGALLDSSLDRYAEVFMFLGVAFHFVSRDYYLTSIMVFIALGGSMMVSYVRARAEGLGFDCKVGLMQRPERIVYIGVSSLIHEYVLLVVIWMIAILANFTALQRIYHVWNLEKGNKEKVETPVDDSLGV